MLPLSEIVALPASSLILNSVPSHSSLIILAFKGVEKEKTANKGIKNLFTKKGANCPLFYITVNY